MKLTIWLLFAVLVFYCCRSPQTFTINIVEEKLFDSIPSGSGVVYHQKQLLIISDDAPFIYKMSLKDFLYEAIPLKGYASDVYRISKTSKPDFECATTGNIEDKEYLFAFGSGSKSPARDSMLMTDVDDLKQQHIISLGEFYSSLQQQLKLGKKEWNIEGALTYNGSLVLLNRGNNAVVTIAWKEFIKFIQDGTLPKASHYVLQLPQYRGHTARLSGACKLDDNGNVLFCASIEDTPNWYTDGPVLGSFIGIFNIAEKKVKHIAMLQRDSKAILDKIESVEVIEAAGNTAQVVACADNDRGHTKIYLLKIKWCYPAG
ncbi:MAG TPA: hypothetical protein PL009_13945 [Flavipsychrobacter sp.]|nr:hypothetical protein [Flavipsychrobacter sp.]